MAGTVKRGSFKLLSSYNWYTPSWGGLLGFLGMFCLGMLLSGMATVVIMAGSGKWLPEDFFQNYAMIISYPIMFLPAMLYASAKSRRNEFFEVGYEMDNNNFGQIGGFRIAGITVLLTIAMIFVLDPITVALPEMNEATKASMEMLLNGPFLVSFISVSIFAPFFEEWLCRGILLRSLLRKCSPGVAIALSALFFGLIHGNLWQAIPAFIIGCVMGYIYYKTGSLKLTMLLHFVNNSCSLLLSQVSEIEAYDTLNEMMGGWTAAYIICILAALIVSFFCLRKFSKIECLSSQGSCREIPVEE